MKESYVKGVKGLANHNDPEPQVAAIRQILRGAEMNIFTFVGASLLTAILGSLAFSQPVSTPAFYTFPT